MTTFVGPCGPARLDGQDPAPSGPVTTGEPGFAAGPSGGVDGAAGAGTVGARGAEADGRARSRWSVPARERVALAGVTAVSLLLGVWNLSANGLGNQYYAAATRSMTASWGNAFLGQLTVPWVMRRLSRAGSG